MSWPLRNMGSWRAVTAQCSGGNKSSRRGTQAPWLYHHVQHGGPIALLGEEKVVLRESLLGGCNSVQQCLLWKGQTTSHLAQTVGYLRFLPAVFSADLL